MQRIPLKKPAKRRQPYATTMEVAGVLEAPKLTPRELQFVSEYLIDFNLGRAAAAVGLSPRTASEQGSLLLKRPHVLAEVHRQFTLNREKLQLQREDVMQMWFDLAYADPTELSPVMVACCRHCYGEDHEYQYTTIELRQEYLKHREKHKNSKHAPPAMDEKGGDGYDPRLPPFSIENGMDHDCPECHGIGIQKALPFNPKKLSRAGKQLYNGIKIDKQGNVQIVFNDRLKALEKLEQHLGLLKPRRGVKVVNFDDIEDDELDALLSEARSRGLLREEEVPSRKMVDITPARTSRELALLDEDDRVS